MKNDYKIDKDESSDTHVPDDPDYETSENIFESVSSSSEAGVRDLTETLDMSTIKFQIKFKFMKNVTL